MTPRVDSILFLGGKLGAPGQYGSLLALIEALADHDVRVGLIHTRTDPIERFARARIPIRSWRSIARGMPAFVAHRRLRLLADECGAKLVHVHGAAAAPAAGHLARAARIPCVASVVPPIGKSRELRRLGRSAARIIAPTESLREDLVNRAHLPKEKITLVPYGIDVAEYQAVCTGGGAVPVVGTAASLEPGQGMAKFIEAARIVLDRGHRALFTIVGHGPEESRLRMLAAERGVQPHLTFVSRLADHRPILAAMGIYVQPATAAGTEFTLLEAMAMGKPVVASDVGGVYSIVADSESGRLVPKGDSAALAEAIGDLLSDIDLARRLGQKAREVVRKHFALDVAVAKTLAIYDEVLAQ